MGRCIQTSCFEVCVHLESSMEHEQFKHWVLPSNAYKTGVICFWADVGDNIDLELHLNWPLCRPGVYLGPYATYHSVHRVMGCLT